MAQKEEQSLEDYVERFQYNIRWSNQHQLYMNTLQELFLKGILDECLDVLNLMGVGDVSQLPYNTICELCKQYSRDNNKQGRGSWEILSRISKPLGSAVTPVEIGNLLDNFKTDILSSLSSLLNTMKINKKQDE